jgi:hypothetical protein
MSNYLDLAKKLKALADKGEDGEKQNAEAMLKRLMQKHGISLTDLEESYKLQHSFKVKKTDERLFLQIVSSVVGSGFQLYGNKTKPGHLFLFATPAEVIEIESKFNFFKIKYKQAEKLFFKAFVWKNDLVPANAETMEANELTEENKKAYLMSMALDKHIFYKQIEN